MAVTFGGVESGQPFVWDADHSFWSARFYLKDPDQDLTAETGTATPIEFTGVVDGILSFIRIGQPVTIRKGQSVLPFFAPEVGRKG